MFVYFFMQVAQTLERKIGAKASSIANLSIHKEVVKDLRVESKNEVKVEVKTEVKADSKKDASDLKDKVKDADLTKDKTNKDSLTSETVENKLDLKDENLETLLTDIKEIENWTVRYAFDKQEGLIYAAKSAYHGSGYGSNEDLYSQMKQSLEADKTDTMSIPEAEETIQDIQYAAVTGNFADVDSRDRERFANWALFYPELRQLFHAMYAITDNINYSRTM